MAKRKFALDHLASGREPHIVPMILTGDRGGTLAVRRG